MSLNAKVFEEFLTKENIVLEKSTDENRALYIVRDKLEGIGPVALMALFDDSDRFVTLICYRYLEFPAEKSSAMLDIVNTLNAEYTMLKFVVKDAALSAQIVVPFRENFTPRIIVDMIAHIFQSMKEEHPRLLEVVNA